ncbi:MAG: ABC transporter permease [Bryobacteraceae bacterium]|nr:ABC transporter permease [Bryobacteraceae bacterium]
MFKYLSLILKNSVRSKRRSALTVLSIAASLCLLGVLGAFYHVFFLDPPTEEQALRLWVRNRISLANPLPLAYQQRIAGAPGVRDVMVFQWFGGTYKDREAKNFFARFAVEPERLFSIYPEYRVAEDQKLAFQRERTACMVGRKLADRLGFKLGDRIVLEGDIFPVRLELTVRAVYDSPRDNENLLFHFEYLKESMPGYRGEMVSNFVIAARSAEEVPHIAEAVDAMFRNSAQQTKTETEKAFELSFLAFIGNVKVFLLSVCSAITFTILLVSGNTMAMSVRERVREVGILKTLGFTRGAILGVILAEAVVIALLGGIIGMFIAAGILDLMSRAPSIATDMSRLTLPPLIWGLCLAVSIFVGAVSAFVPAWNASRRSIVEALRFTD